MDLKFFNLICTHVYNIYIIINLLLIFHLFLTSFIHWYSDTQIDTIHKYRKEVSTKVNDNNNN